MGKNILLATLGTSPAVVTEAVDLLREEGITISGVYLFITQDRDVQDSFNLLAEYLPQHDALHGSTSSESGDKRLLSFIVERSIQSKVMGCEKSLSLRDRKSGVNIMNRNSSILINLIGEQPAPNLLPVYELSPAFVILAYTSRTQNIAKRLKKLLNKRGLNVFTCQGDPYNIYKTYCALNKKIQDFTRGKEKLIGNMTGGTKLMVLALLKLIQTWSQNSKYGAELCYLQSEQTQGILHFYDPVTFQKTRQLEIKHSISIDDYLASFLDDYWFIGPSKSEGGRFERNVAEHLNPHVDELKIGLKVGRALEVDMVIRCGNQIGIAEIKTGRQANTKKGIDQLNTAGGREFLGIYVKKFLIVDRSWEDMTALKELARARNVILIELPSFSEEGRISVHDQVKLVQQVRSALLCKGQ